MTIHVNQFLRHLALISSSDRSSVNTVDVPHDLVFANLQMCLIIWWKAIICHLTTPLSVISKLYIKKMSVQGSLPLNHSNPGTLFGKRSNMTQRVSYKDNALSMNYHIWILISLSLFWRAGLTICHHCFEIACTNHDPLRRWKHAYQNYGVFKYISYNTLYNGWQQNLHFTVFERLASGACVTIPVFVGLVMDGQGILSAIRRQKHRNLSR